MVCADCGHTHGLGTFCLLKVLKLQQIFMVSGDNYKPQVVLIVTCRVDANNFEFETTYGYIDLSIECRLQGQCKDVHIVS